MNVVIAIKSILILIVLIGLYLSYALIIRTKASRFLGYYILFITLIAINQILSFYSSLFTIFPIFNAILGYALAPYLYFHVLALLNLKNLSATFKLHLLINSPVLVVIVFWIFDDYRRKILGIDTNSLTTIFLALQTTIYLTLLVQQFLKRRPFIKTIKLTLQYKRLIWGVGLMCVNFLIMTLVLADNFWVEDSNSLFFVLTIFSLILFQLLAIFSKKVIDPSFFISSDKLIIQQSPSKKIEENLEDQIKHVHVMLDHLMNTDRVFKNPELTLNILSEKMNVKPRVLSDLLKKYYSQTFSEYISAKRLDEAKQQLSHSTESGKRINEIMYDVGFNSKSTFNTWFKKNTGLTPSKYRKKSF